MKDLNELQLLFINSITRICCADYLPNQIDAWIASTKNHTNQQRWLDVIRKQFVLVAENAHQILGFASLDHGSYVDLFFVRDGYQRQGIARRLYASLEDEAIRLQTHELTAQVSITAKPFFEKMQFEVLNQQTVVLNGVSLTNYKMHKYL